MDETLWSKGRVFGAEVFRGKTNSGNVLRMSAKVEWGCKPRASGLKIHFRESRSS